MIIKKWFNLAAIALLAVCTSAAAATFSPSSYGARGDGVTTQTSNLSWAELVAAL